QAVIEVAPGMEPGLLQDLVALEVLAPAIPLQEGRWRSRQGEGPRLPLLLRGAWRHLLTSFPSGHAAHPVLLWSLGRIPQAPLTAAAGRPPPSGGCPGSGERPTRHRSPPPPSPPAPAGRPSPEACR